MKSAVGLGALLGSSSTCGLRLYFLHLVALPFEACVQAREVKGHVPAFKSFGLEVDLS